MFPNNFCTKGSLHWDCTKNAQNPQNFNLIIRITAQIGTTNGRTSAAWIMTPFLAISKTSPISMFLTTFLEMPEMLSTVKATREA